MDLAIFCDTLSTKWDLNLGYLKWQEIQLVVHFGVGSIITIRFVANCKPTALSLLNILDFEQLNYVFLNTILHKTFS